MFSALLLVIALIAYGCLYPFRFHALPADPWTVFWSSWPAALTRTTVRDTVVNVVLYLPLGLFTFLALDRIRIVWLRFLIPVGLALLLSTGIEFLQLMDFGRTSSAYDVVCDVAGATLGAIAGRLYAGWVSKALRRTRDSLAGAPAASFLLCLWLGYALFPLFPSLSVYTMAMELRSFFTGLSFSPPEAVRAWIEWLALATVLQSVVGRAKIGAWMLVLLLLLPARLVFFHRTLFLAELTGAVLAWIAWKRAFNRMPRPALLLGWLLVAGLVLQELLPFRFSRTPQPFSWVPFAAVIDTGPDSGALIFFRKSFWYGSAVWAFREAGCGFLRPAIAVSLLLASLECIQRYLPGRTPEISDPLLVLLLALFLCLSEQRCQPVP